MKMHERLIPEWKHAQNTFCVNESVTPKVLNNKSTSPECVRIRDMFYAFCVATGVSINDMLKATGKSRGTVYHSFNKDSFRSLVRRYSNEQA